MIINYIFLGYHEPDSRSFLIIKEICTTLEDILKFWPYGTSSSLTSYVFKVKE